ncbi:uracil-DNA glycosylase [Paenibacillus sp. 481]|uniref:uracil-DNA glycosylase n=1 Tax=Paenibacillus sp. 481 TaxID=2835869 RepID=UPI001E6163BF|nr:uracil-DNA glycosylase [Paenibacillus sp. 481]UHA75806.1 uracil-DNA glycosylase [Paenibacillus sp. 481]
MHSMVNNDWADLLRDEIRQPYFRQLWGWLKEQYEDQTIYPQYDHIFSALNYTAYQDTKVVILGQDPYHGPGQAHGLSFSVLPGVPAPPSLRNMFKECAADVGTTIPNHGYLAPWAEQGVLMLNTVLTVMQGQAASHRNRGWEQFTDTIITLLNERERPMVFVLWGSHAQAKIKLIDTSKHAIIKGPHPSPLSAHRGFFGSRPFSQINEQLRRFEEPEINWQLANL